MRRSSAALVGLVCAAAGCGGDANEYSECGDGGACAENVCLPGRLAKADRRPLRALPPVERTVRVAWTPVGEHSRCEQYPATLEVRRGIPASVALFGPNQVYVADDVPLQTRDNPVHQYLYDDSRSRWRKPSCRARELRGRLRIAGSDGLLRIGRETVRVVEITRLRLPEIDGVPRLSDGLRVRAKAFDCPERGTLIARSIEAAN